jgi:hypothetical protein
MPVVGSVAVSEVVGGDTYNYASRVDEATTRCCGATVRIVYRTSTGQLVPQHYNVQHERVVGCPLCAKSLLDNLEDMRGVTKTYYSSQA